MYVDHPTFFESPSVSRLVGVIHAPHFDSQAACMKAQVHVLALQAADTVELLDTLLVMRASGDPLRQSG